MDILGAAMPALHILVDKPLPTTDAPWWRSESFWVAVGAITTGIMAWFTRSLAQETRDTLQAAGNESNQRERHHRESLTPLLYAEILESRLRATLSENTNKYSYYIQFVGKLRNVGPGPATGVLVHFIPMEMARQRFFEPPIGSNGLGSFDLKYVCEFDATKGGKVNFIWPHECAIEYADLFGNRGWLILKSSSATTNAFKLVESAKVRPFDLSLP